MAVAGEIEGLDAVLANLNKEAKAIKGRTQAGYTLAGQYVRRESQKEAPVVEGNLKASAYVVSATGKSLVAASFKGEDAGGMATQHGKETQTQKAIMTAARVPGVAVGYSALYAAIVHENPRSGKTGGVSPTGKKYTAGLTESGKKSKRAIWSEVGKWKFLEDPLKRSTKKILQIIGSKAKIK